MFGAWGLGFRLEFQTLGFTASLLSRLSPVSPPTGAIGDMRFSV